MRIITTFILLLITLMGITLLHKADNQQTKPIAICFLTILLFMITRLFFKLRYFIYEHSGEVISIKYFHPLKDMKHLSTIELPQQKLHSFSLRQGTIDCTLTFVIKGRKKKRFFKYHIQGLAKNQIKEIINTLEK